MFFVIKNRDWQKKEGTQNLILKNRDRHILQSFSFHRAACTCFSFRIKYCVPLKAVPVPVFQ